MLARIRHAFRSFFGPVLRDRRGVAAVFLAVALVPLIGATGLAIDSALGYLLKTRMSKSLDSAGLAAGRIALDDNADEVARQYFDANFGANAEINVTDFDFELDPTLHFVTLTAEATRPTYFMRVFGHDTMTVAARSVIERQTTGMELALVLDNTGSMQDDDKFETMQQAAYDLIEIIYGDDETIDNLWISVVPFVTSVNIGTSHKSWIKTTDRVYTSPNSWNSSNTKPWAGCVVARSPSLDVDDTPPSGGLWSSWRWVNNLPSGANGNRNYACPAPIKGLTAARTEIDAALAAMSAAPKASGTATNYGLVWGWRTLSPLWRGLWGGSTPSELPLDYNTDRMEKVAVVLTDGENQMVQNHYTSYGTWSDHGFTSLAQTTDFLDAKTTQVCDAMKAEGIRIFSIIFGPAPDADAQELLRDCATTEAMYYYAPSNEDLDDAFRAIGGQLANLMIVE
jgi:Flp pilus assembly protein TadG